MHHVVRNIKKTLVWALPAVSLVVLPNTFFPFITGKAFLFRIVVELVFFLYVFLAISDATYRPKWNSLSIIFAIFTFVMFIADIFAVDPSKAIWSNFERMDGFVTLAHLFVYFMVAESVLRDTSDWRIWKLSTVAISLFMIFFCFLQLSGEAIINQGGVRVDGSLGNAAYLGTYLVFQFFFLVYLWVSDRVDFKEISLPFVAGGFGYSLYYLIRISNAGATHTSYGLAILFVAIILAGLALSLRPSKNFIRRFGNISAHILYCIITISYLVILYHTATRGAILGLIGGLFVGALYIVIKEKENKIVRKVGVGMVLAVCVFIGGFYLIKDSLFVQQSPVLSRFASLSLATKGQARNYVWPMAFEGFKERPILGWGQEGFSYVFQKYYVPEMITQEPFFDRAHNSFLDWLIAGGILGFLPYVFLYLIAFLFIWRSVMFSNKEKAALIALILAYAFQNFFIFDNLISYILFVSLLAFVSAHYNSKKRGDQIQKISDEGKVPLLFACLVGFVIVALLINLKGYQQNTTLIEALSPQQKGVSENLALFKKAIAYNSFGTLEAREQLMRVSLEIIASTQVTDNTKIAFANMVIEEMEKQTKETKEDMRSFYEIGDFLVKIGAYDQAIPKLEYALQLSPKKQQISFALAQAYFGKANQTKIEKEKQDGIKTALSIVKNIYDLSPSLDAVKIPYTQALIYSGKIEEAVHMIKEINNPSIFVDESLIKVIVDNGYVSDTEDMLKRVIQIDSKNANAYIMLSNVYVSMKNKDKAIKALEDMKLALPEYSAEADKDIEAVKAHFK